MMKKLVTSALLVLILAAILTACGSKNGSSTPGNLAVPTPRPTPHPITGEVDVSSDYHIRLCTDLWLDTNTLHCCRLNEDGTYSWLQSKTDSTQIESGHWRLTKDDQKYLTLYLKDDVSGKEQILYELELYEQSIYYIDAEGNGIVWLVTDKEEQTKD